MIRRFLQRHQFWPKDGTTWVEHCGQLQAMQQGQTETPEPTEGTVDDELAQMIERYGVEHVKIAVHAYSKLLESPNPVINRRALRKKFGIRKGDPDPAWFDSIELV